MSNIDKHAELRKELSNPANGSNAHLRKLALALLDELEKMQAQSSKWCEAFHKAVSVGARYEERIAELSELLKKSDVEKKQPQNTLSGRPVYLGDGSDTKEKVIAGKRDIHRYESLITDRAGKGD
ncbi:hypothetical protein [Enterobacter cloacae complex sp. 277I4]|uniref:hypothetical protein n=1 Tax=Enterobacter cloacae complex sp. 277I4 TaxID=3395873 RepID=UPI003CEC4F17